MSLQSFVAVKVFFVNCVVTLIKDLCRFIKVMKDSIIAFVLVKVKSQSDKEFSLTYTTEGENGRPNDESHPIYAF